MQTRQGFQQRGFPGAVWTDYDEKLALANLQRHIIDHRAIAIFQAEIIDVDQAAHRLALQSRLINNGAPIKAVTIPTDISPWLGRLRANISQTTR